MAKPNNNVNYMTVSQLPTNVILNRAYKVTTKQLEYEGHAVKGSANSDTCWTVRKYTYNGDNQISTERMAYNIAWDDRETSTYD